MEQVLRKNTVTIVNNNIKIIESLYSSKDYDTFKFVIENREIDEKHVQSIINGMKNNTAHSPITVALVAKKGTEFDKDGFIIKCGRFIRSADDINDEEFYIIIIDGQHRCLACTELGYEIKFTISFDCKGIEDIQSLNENGKNWTYPDVIYSQSKRGNDHYIRMGELIKKYDILKISATTIQDIQQHLDGPRRLSKQAFKSGKLVLSEKMCVKIEKVLKNLIDIKALLTSDVESVTKNRWFIGGYIPIMTNTNYNHKHMLSQIEKRGATKIVRNNDSIYPNFEMLVDLYNSYKQKKVPFAINQV